MPSSRDPLIPADVVATAIVTHLRNMERAGYGKFSMAVDDAGVRATFGSFAVCAENADICLVRLAGLLLEDPELSIPMLAALRGPSQ